jgi:hypothetical protein
MGTDGTTSLRGQLTARIENTLTHRAELDIEVSFALRRLNPSAGQVPDNDTAGAVGISFRFGIVAQLSFAGQYADLEFELGSEALRFGFSDLSTRLFIPQLPQLEIRRDDLDRLRGNDGARDPAIRLRQIEPEIDQRLADAEAELEAARRLLEDGGIDDEQLLLGQLSGLTAQTPHQGLVEVY